MTEYRFQIYLPRLRIAIRIQGKGMREQSALPGSAGPFYWFTFLLSTRLWPAVILLTHRSDRVTFLHHLQGTITLSSVGKPGHIPSHLVFHSHLPQPPCLPVLQQKKASVCFLECSFCSRPTLLHLSGTSFLYPHFPGRETRSQCHILSDSFSGLPMENHILLLLYSNFIFHNAFL